MQSHNEVLRKCHPICCGSDKVIKGDLIMSRQIEPKLIAGNSNQTLAREIARKMPMQSGKPVALAETRVERFNDGEVFVEVFENVRGEDMFIIQSTSNPANDNLMELLIMTDALRRSSAARITAVIPYFGYARQDRRTKARTPISAKLVANLIAEAGIERDGSLQRHVRRHRDFTRCWRCGARARTGQTHRCPVGNRR